MRRPRRAASVAVATLLIGATVVAAWLHDRTTPTSVDTADRHAAAVSYAQQLLSRIPTTNDDTPLATAPLPELRDAVIQATSHQVSRSRYWMSNDPVNQTFAALTATTPNGMRVDGPTENGSPHRAHRNQKLDFTVSHPPTTIAAAYLSIEVIDVGQGHSAVAVSAVAVPQPMRPEAELVPLSAHPAQLVEVVDSFVGAQEKPSHTVTPRTIDGPPALTLVRDFNTLKVDPGFAQACDGAVKGFEATFRSAGHTWRVGYGACTVSVTRDGHKLPELLVDKAFEHALVTPFDASSARTRRAEAVAEAERLLRRAPTTASETRVASPPSTSLRSAPETTGGRTVISRRRFWSSSRPLAATLRALKRRAPHGLMLTFGGATTDRGRVIERDAEILPPHLPPTLASAVLQIEVVPDGHGRSAVGAYTQVVPQPIRHSREFVPLAVMTVRLATITQPHSVTARRTVDGRAAYRLIREFNALRVQPPFGARSCPLQLVANTATFRIDGHAWRVEDSICGSDVVTRDGHRLPDLVPGSEFSRDLSADLR
jgi:hypothetical protein